MILANSQKQFQLHLESYMVYEKEHKVGHCHQLCSLLFFVVFFFCSFFLSVHIKNVKLFISQFCGHIICYCIQKKKTGLWVE